MLPAQGAAKQARCASAVLCGACEHVVLACPFVFLGYSPCCRAARVAAAKPPPIPGGQSECRAPFADGLRSGAEQSRWQAPARTQADRRGRSRSHGVRAGTRSEATRRWAGSPRVPRSEAKRAPGGCPPASRATGTHPVGGRAAAAAGRGPVPLPLAHSAPSPSAVRHHPSTPTQPVTRAGGPPTSSAPRALDWGRGAGHLKAAAAVRLKQLHHTPSKVRGANPSLFSFHISCLTLYHARRTAGGTPPSGGSAK